MKSLPCLLLPAAFALACGPGSPYEAEYDCTQVLSCMEAEEGFVLGPSAVADCTAQSQGEYDGLTHKQSADAWFSACKDTMGCAYVDCKAEENGVDRAFIANMSERYDTRQPCEEGVISRPGQLETPQGTIPYESIEISLTHNEDYDCLSKVTVAFMMGYDCSLLLEADHRDAEGRYVIYHAGLENFGSCANYPAWLGASYSEASDAVPLGTITVDRPLSSWDECVEGSLSISLDVVLTGTPGVSPDVDLTGVWVPVPGYYSKTISSFASCAF